MPKTLDLLHDDPRRLSEARERHPEKAHRPDSPVSRKPPWIRVKAPGSALWRETSALLEGSGPLHRLPGGGLSQHRRMLGAKSTPPS